MAGTRAGVRGLAVSNSREERDGAASALTGQEDREGRCVCVWGAVGNASQPWHSHHPEDIAQSLGGYGAPGPCSLSQVLWLAFDFLFELQFMRDTVNEGCLPN